MKERPALEVADVIRAHGAAFLDSHGASLSAVQRRLLRDLEACRTAALGGHVEQCAACGYERIAYNSCRNRHCPKCQAAARAVWLEREASYLLPVEYHHVVFTLPAPVADLALQNRAVVYSLLFRAAQETLRALAADPHYLGAELGVLMVLHTWGQNLHHHPHVHCVVTGGGLSCDLHGVVDPTPHWMSCRPGFFLPVRVLSRLFRGKFLALLQEARAAGRLTFHGRLADLAEPRAFAAWLTPLYQAEWVVYAKPPFGGPQQVLKYLARYTHRVAISNRRLQALEDGRVTFQYKDYAHDNRQRTLTLDADEFLRRFLLHVLPRGFVKIRHCGLLANRGRDEKLTQCRRLLVVAQWQPAAAAPVSPAEPQVVRCPVCAGECWVRLRLLPRRASEPVAASVPLLDTG
jgi:putative transposase/transposase-like zinc-binding protein